MVLFVWSITRPAKKSCELANAVFISLSSVCLSVSVLVAAEFGTLDIIQRISWNDCYSPLGDMRGSK